MAVAAAQRGLYGADSHTAVRRLPGPEADGRDADAVVKLVVMVLFYLFHILLHSSVFVRRRQMSAALSI